MQRMKDGIICPNCGEKIPARGMRCRYCGHVKYPKYAAPPWPRNRKICLTLVCIQVVLFILIVAAVGLAQFDKRLLGALWLLPLCWVLSAAGLVVTLFGLFKGIPRSAVDMSCLLFNFLVCLVLFIVFVVLCFFVYGISKLGSFG